ncbi:hypothetical protein [Streptomyces sp. NPDC056628]|uniref:hypothetical protein n=1 Tax=Streptomyces sp. NPDC056628 TaxID=3345882 RepID=UPI003676491C
MTENETVMLCLGFALGAQGMALLHAWWNMRDADRSLAESEAARKRAAGDHYLSSLRLYRLQQRSRV